MLQPTDRVIAKTLVRILSVVSKTHEPDIAASANTLMNATLQETLPNVELLLAVTNLIGEVANEAYAEQSGNASPVAAPWAEDAGSGC